MKFFNNHTRIKHYGPTPIDLNDRKNEGTAVELALPDNFSDKAKDCWEYFEEAAFIFEYKERLVVTDESLYLTTYDDGHHETYGAPRWEFNSWEELEEALEQAYDDPKQRYGAVKICRVLDDNGTPCSVKRVQRHMAGQGLRSVVVKKYNHHTSHGSILEDKKNILGRDLETETINQKWCTDITYIHVQKEGWTYLPSVMDLCSRKIIGYAYGTSMTAGLAVKAVENACLNVRDTRGIILHSDLRSQYTSQAIFGYIEGWYNRKRIHSSIGYLTPQQKEDEELKKAA